eukprot:2882-Pleurochrysis_carterae.AAC.1
MSGSRALYALQDLCLAVTAPHTLMLLPQPFKLYGEIADCEIVMRQDGKSRGVGFVEFAAAGAAKMLRLLSVLAERWHLCRVMMALRYLAQTKPLCAFPAEPPDTYHHHNTSRVCVTAHPATTCASVSFLCKGSVLQRACC